ncbi:MAG: transporter, family, methylenomycin resistance protein [Solirubrobacteraceae bacterium]|jgi:DHA2 family methylenomycin A resistance protein-like MFS transporter|nr:transporter, family, methylenomycin resistance protein [Solirubrobacteraceae bacterium]
MAGFSMVLLDTTIVNVALGSIARDFAAGPATLGWIANAYTLVFAGLLLSTGLAADRIGARTVFVSGLAIFAFGSVLATIAPSAGALIGAQAVLGVGAALVLPTSLSLLSQVFTDASRRMRAIGVWAAGSSVAFAAGPVLGGVLIEQFGWRSIFVINLPLAALGAALVLTQVRGRTETKPTGALNLGAQAAAIAMLVALTFGLVESTGRGWGSAPVLIAVGAAVVLAAGLLVRERSTRNPLVPRELVADRRFTASTAGGALLNFAFYGELFFLSLFLQQERGLDALHTGLAFLPQPLLFMSVAPFAGRLVASRGPRLPLALGAALGAAGAFVLLGVDIDSSYGVLMVGLALGGMGGGLAVPAVTAGVMGSAPTALAGIASATLNAGRQVGGVLGVALLGGLASASGHVEASAMHTALLIAGLALVAASALAFALPAPDRAPARDLALATE